MWLAPGEVHVRPRVVFGGRGQETQRLQSTATGLSVALALMHAVDARHKKRV